MEHIHLQDIREEEDVRDVELNKNVVEEELHEMSSSSQEQDDDDDDYDEDDTNNASTMVEELLSPLNGLDLEDNDILHNKHNSTTIHDLSKALEIPTTPILQDMESAFSEYSVHDEMSVFLPGSPVCNNNNNTNNGSGVGNGNNNVTKLRSNSHSLANNMTYHFNNAIMNSVSHTKNNSNGNNSILLSPNTSYTPGNTPNLSQKGRLTGFLKRGISTDNLNQESTSHNRDSSVLLDAFGIGIDTTPTTTESRRNSLQRFRLSSMTGNNNNSGSGHNNLMAGGRKSSRNSVSTSSPISNTGQFEDSILYYQKSRKNSIISNSQQQSQNSLGLNVKRSFSKLVSTTGSLKRAISSASLNNRANSSNYNNIHGEKGLPNYGSSGILNGSGINISTTISNDTSGTGNAPPMARLHQGETNNTTVHDNNGKSKTRKRGTTINVDSRSSIFKLNISRDNSVLHDHSMTSDGDSSSSANYIYSLNSNLSTKDNRYLSETRNKKLHENYDEIYNNEEEDDYYDDHDKSDERLFSSTDDLDDNEEFVVDIDKLTRDIPVITVTDKIGSKNSTPVLEQTNLMNAQVDIKKRSRQNSNASSSLSNNSANRMGLAEYIKVMIRQQNLEDERLDYLEKNFRECGWCSHEELQSIRQKRIMINRKWASRISHYQSKLEA